MRHKIGLYLVLVASVILNVFLAGIAARTGQARIGKGGIKGVCIDKTTADDAVVVFDTTCVSEPTAVSERLLGFDTIPLERADKGSEGCGKKEKDEKRNVVLKGESGKLEVSCETTLVSNNKRLTSDTASCQQVSDSVMAVVPITERTYEDSIYKAVVRGYNPELVSLDIYKQQTTVYRQQTRKPKVVLGIGPYAGFGNKGFNYGIAVNVSMPIWSW